MEVQAFQYAKLQFCDASQFALEKRIVALVINKMIQVSERLNNAYLIPKLLPMLEVDTQNYEAFCLVPSAHRWQKTAKPGRAE